VENMGRGNGKGLEVFRLFFFFFLGFLDLLDYLVVSGEIFREVGMVMELVLTLWLHIIYSPERY